MRNVEIKAKIANLQSLLQNIDKLCPSSMHELVQEDIFYYTTAGRLKLRKFKDETAELIFYNRPNEEGPKLSDFEKSSIQKTDVESLNKVLAKALGVRGIVSKKRQLFMVGQTRIHVDHVEGLGDFVELEVQLKDDQTIEEGQRIANELMEKLDISKDYLLATAYADLLNL